MSTSQVTRTGYFKELCLSIWIIIASIIFTGAFPFILVFIVLPVKLYSKFVAYLAYLLRPDLRDILTGISAAQILDIDVINEKPRITEVVCLRLKGPLDYDKIVEAFYRRVVLRTDPKKAHHGLQYPELRQYFTKFLDYVFFATDHHFNVKDHFRFYDENQNEPITRVDLTRIWEELMIKPFKKNKSPWEIVLVDNYIPDKDELETWNCTTEGKYWVAFVRMHHGMGDGFSVQKMLSYLADEEFMPKFPARITPFQDVLMSLRTVFLGPYDIVWRFYRGMETYHDLHLHPSKQSGEYYVTEGKLISTNDVKSVRKKFGVAFTTVLVAAISGGLRRYYLKYNKPIPNYLSTAIPIATIEHQDGMTNEFLLATVEYAVNKDDPKERIEYVEDKMKLLTTTSWINMFNFIIDVSGTFPQSVFKRLGEKQIFSSTYSTQPGPSTSISSFGATVLDVNYAYGCGPHSATFGISTLTYNGNFRMVLFIDKNAVKSREVAKDMVEFISEEFEVLEYYPYDHRLVKEEKRKSEWNKSKNYD